MSFVKSIFNFLRFNKKNWKAVVLCIVAATVFWFFNALNKNYTTNISFPVAFEYDQEHFIPLQTLPTTVRMNVSGSGWDLFRRSSGFKIPALIIPLEKPAEVRKIIGTQLPAIFASQLEKLQINFVITDTLHIGIDRKIRRKFTLTLDSVAQYIHPDFGITSEVQLTPDTLWLEGPEAAIKALPKTLTLELPNKNIKKNYAEAIAFSQRQGITTDPLTVTVMFSVAEFTTLDKRIRLTVINSPVRKSANHRIAETINCTLWLARSEAENFNADSLVAIIDLKAVPRGAHKLVPEILGLPATISVLKADTVLVNF